MSKIRINSISIKNYRSFGEQQTFFFPNETYKKPTAIVGYNNSGKTNLMNCILYGIGNKFIQSNTFEANDLHNLDYENNIEISTDIAGSEFSCEKYWDKITNTHKTEKSITNTYKITSILDDNELKSEMKPSMFGLNKHYNIFYINFHNIKQEIITRKSTWGGLTSFLAKHISKLVAIDTEMNKKKSIYEQEVKNATDEVLKDSMLHQFIGAIKENYSTNLRDNNCEVTFGLPDYQDIFLQMIFKIGLNGSKEHLIPIDHFGDGYISMFIMAVIKAIAESNTEDKCLFLFEEPESFLHENHQEYFYKTVLCNLSDNGHQVIYTTHSDKMVDIFDTQGIIRIEFDEKSKQTLIKYNETDTFTLTMPQNENEENIISYDEFNNYIKFVEPNLNKILFSRKVILVEGANDILAYKTAIEKEVERLKGNKNYAQTYLNFLNMAFIVHHGKGTAYLLIDLCKHFKLEYFVINDWDFDEDFIQELANIKDETQLKSSNLYLKKNGIDRSSAEKGQITTNWKLLNSAELSNIHFNIPKLENVLGYPSNNKSSLGILNKVRSFTNYPESFLPQKLRDYLELNSLEI
ncbi:Predicted ATP-dependent endonuclease of the OLD family, contains P-loop ATPase and TOPRIM domains [Flexibacter flexilis DSM 6793]|uniref:Predicted ATP-dependent endonuclease of the OLD family, contains P-loop ATPase and TOPRIM domains n=1 Tax=Flexibacter flexilis DSM 6793 TaxID=927664 RepID=A0A1I1NQ85_9BACT|nr:AAA family ATPase [Flexibacter flexilis]SFC95900.1 Predicted ATP-dependent endonuclease of the OLD family, contains P-loop ATPase and TOPRIM domains [Flexibacter flexilis DSM 6793]